MLGGEVALGGEAARGGWRWVVRSGNAMLGRRGNAGGIRARAVGRGIGAAGGEIISTSRLARFSAVGSIFNGSIKIGNSGGPNIPADVDRQI